MSSYKEMYLHVPAYILCDGRLDPTKIILISEIINLNSTPKGCYAGNKRFGKLLGINPDGASKQITILKKLGFVQTEYKNGYRYIKLIKQISPVNEIDQNIIINIPYSILFDANLSSTQKLLLSEIIALSNLPDGCYKSNNELGELIGIGGSGISKQIKKLVEMKYITTEEIKIGNATDHRKIELGTSYTTREVLPKSLGGTSQMTRGVLPTRLEGTSCRNTITTVYISKETLPVLAQFTSTEKIDEMSEIEILEQKIIDSCPRGLELLEHVKIKPVDNIWNFVTNKEELCNALSLIKQFKDASNKPLNEDVSVTNGIDEV
jgi:Mn-dependent DtxR family transcriptional regulator